MGSIRHPTPLGRRGMIGIRRGNIARRVAVIGLTIVSPSSAASAQQTELSPAVTAFVSVDEPVVALTHARVIDGSGSPAMADQTLVIRNGTIAALGPSGSVPVPENAEVIDLTGKSVIPGLVMLHEHMFYPAGGSAYNQQEYSFPRLYLAGGVTTLRTGGSRDPYGDLNLKRAIDAGVVPGPTVYVTGPYLNGPGLPILFVNALDGPQDARRMVAYWSDEGVTSFKAYMHISREELGAAIDEAHQRGHKVTGHLCSVTYREAADLGIDNLEHGLFASTDFVDGKEPDVCPSGSARGNALFQLDPRGPEALNLIGHLVERGVALTSTLPVFEISTPGRPRASDGALDAMSPDARERYLRTWSRIQEGDSTRAVLLRKSMEFERLFAEAGGLLVAGIDPTGYGGVVPGFANHREIELLVEGGFTPEEAIKVATYNGAVYLGLDDRLGTVAVGKAADLVVINGDPAARIEDIRKVEIVFKGGVGFDSARLFASVKGTVGVR